jgi:hypothetical protein
MAERRGNRAPDTTQVRENEIARMKVDELRSQLRSHGVPGTSSLRKEELVKKLVKTLRSEQRKSGPSRPPGSSGSFRTSGSSAKKSTSASSSGAGWGSRIGKTPDFRNHSTV